MPNHPVYGCTRCGRHKDRDQLVVKKALFVGMGEGSATIRSRVTAWLCPECLEEDSDFQREKFNPPRIEVPNAS